MSGGVVEDCVGVEECEGGERDGGERGVEREERRRGRGRGVGEDEGLIWWSDCDGKIECEVG